MNATLRSMAIVIALVAAAGATGRLMSAQKFVDPSLIRDADNDTDADRRNWPRAKPRPMPTFSSNDRARWATVRSLVDEGTYAVGKRETTAEPPGYKDSGIIFEDGWQSIDRVLRPDTSEFYSSKPPLLPTLVAGLYWLLQSITGWTLQARPAHVVRTLLLLINIIPFAFYLLTLDRWVGRFAKEPWTRFVVLVAAAFGTTVTPFLITFNNHTPATFCVLFALDGVFAIWFATTRRPWLAFLQAGFFAAFAAACELPALAFAAAVFGLLAMRDLKRTALIAAPPALLVATAFFGTNYLALGQLGPAYGEFNADPAAAPGWYQYEGSHWRKPAEGVVKYGIDWARMHESRGQYAFHVLVGHHGLFSLTPIWLLAMLGALGLAFRKRVPDDAMANGEARLPWPWFLGPLTLALTVIVVAFYLYKSDNYGGYSNGLRWLMWLSPLWLLTMVPAVDSFATSAWRRGIVYALLAVSAMSANYSLWNPWQHPWIYDLMKASGWKAYGP